MVKFNDGTFFYSLEQNNVVLGNKEKQNDCQNAIFSYSAVSKNITIPSSVEYDGNTYTVESILCNVFCFHSFKKLIIPKTLKIIGTAAFANCKKLEEVEFEKGSSLVEICGRSFEYCTSLAKIIIPSSVSSIHSHVFRNTSLTHVYYCGRSNFARSVIFSNVNETMKIYTVLGIYPSRYFGQRKTISSTECLIDSSIKGRLLTCSRKYNNNISSILLMIIIIR